MEYRDYMIDTEWMWGEWLEPDQRLGYLHASYDSPYGKITSDWKYEKNRIVYTFEIPANMTATVRLEGCDSETLKAGSYERVVSL